MNAYSKITLSPELPTRFELVVGALDGMRGYQRVAGGSAGVAIPQRRTLVLDPVRLAELEEEHQWLQNKFAEARRSAATTRAFTPADARRMMFATARYCKQCGVMHDVLRAGLCPPCYEESQSF